MNKLILYTLFTALLDFLVDVSKCADPLSLCGDWEQYGDRCLKAVNKTCTKQEAIGICNQLETGSTLVIIHTLQEQTDIFGLIQRFESYSDVEENVWIGINYQQANRRYQWDDNTVLNYTNWADGDPDPQAMNLCVQIDAKSGKWNDEPCTRKNLAICQKKPVLTLNSLHESLVGIFKNLADELNKQQSLTNKLQIEIDQLKSSNQSSGAGSVPVGFIYVQLPNQSEPIDLWPNTNWAEVTQQYSGLFFRAEGGSALPFGEIQSANSSQISTIRSRTLGGLGSFKTSSDIYIPINEGEWSGEIVNGEAFSVLESMKIFSTSTDNRPRNTAVKIWIRNQ